MRSYHNVSIQLTNARREAQDILRQAERAEDLRDASNNTFAWETFNEQRLSLTSDYMDMLLIISELEDELASFN